MSKQTACSPGLPVLKEQLLQSTLQLRCRVRKQSAGDVRVSVRKDSGLAVHLSYGNAIKSSFQSSVNGSVQGFQSIASRTRTGIKTNKFRTWRRSAHKHSHPNIQGKPFTCRWRQFDTSFFILWRGLAAVGGNCHFGSSTTSNTAVNDSIAVQTSLASSGSSHTRETKR